MNAPIKDFFERQFRKCKLSPSEIRAAFESKAFKRYYITIFTMKETSYHNNYERLEFYGDGIVNNAVVSILSKQYISLDVSKSKITKSRWLNVIKTHLIDKERFSSIAMKNGFDRMLKQYNRSAYTSLHDKSVNPKFKSKIDVLEDSLEAFCGLLSLIGDEIGTFSGFLFVYNYMYNIFMEDPPDLDVRKYFDPNTRLKEYIDYLHPYANKYKYNKRSVSVARDRVTITYTSPFRVSLEDVERTRFNTKYFVRDGNKLTHEIIDEFIKETGVPEQAKYSIFAEPTPDSYKPSFFTYDNVVEILRSLMIELNMNNNTIERAIAALPEGIENIMSPFATKSAREATDCMSFIGSYVFDSAIVKFLYENKNLDERSMTRGKINMSVNLKTEFIESVPEILQNINSMNMNAIDKLTDEDGNELIIDGSRGKSVYINAIIGVLYKLIDEVTMIGMSSIIFYRYVYNKLMYKEIETTDTSKSTLTFYVKRELNSNLNNYETYNYDKENKKHNVEYNLGFVKASHSAKTKIEAEEEAAKLILLKLGIKR